MSDRMSPSGIMYVYCTHVIEKITYAYSKNATAIVEEFLVVNNNTHL